jgi:hypothetical protein
MATKKNVKALMILVSGNMWLTTVVSKYVFAEEMATRKNAELFISLVSGTM